MICIILLIVCEPITINAQLLKDTSTLNLIKKDIDCIYNQQFNEAHDIYTKIEKLYPGHPAVFLVRGLLTYWKNYPLLTKSLARISFEKDMHQCIQLSEKNSNSVYKAEFLLYNLCARGMLLKFYDDNNLFMEVIPMLSSSYKYLKQSFSFTGECADLYYYAGVYNYYREAYPKIYPVYRPLASFFHHGNMEKGLEQLNNAAIEAVVLRPESYILLTWIYSHFENNYGKALYYCKSLHEKYPGNVFYLSIYIKNLLLIKQYDAAEKLIVSSLKETENKYFQAQLVIFKGILQEKKYRDNDLALQYYNSGLSKMSFFGVYGDEYAAYAYFGLSRISDTKSEKDISKRFRAKAMKLGDFKKLNFD